MDIGTIGKGKGKHGKGKGKGKQGHQGHQDKNKDRTIKRAGLNVGIVESAVTARRTVGARTARPTKEVQRERTKNKNAKDPHNLDTTKPKQTLNQKLKSVDST